MGLSRKAFSTLLICVFELYMQVAVLGASQVYTCTIGEAAKFLWLRSSREQLKEFRKYRAWKDNVSFAIIENGSQTASCLNDSLKTFCLTKVEFQEWNETHLLLTIKNTDYDDSGDYGVEHVFAGLENNHKDPLVSLKIKAKPTDIPSHRNPPEDDNKTLEKPTDIPSHRNPPEDDNRTPDLSPTTARLAVTSSGVSSTLSTLLIVLLFSLPFLLWASN